MDVRTAVLVVEDETLVRFDIVDHLANEGFVVREAANADEAIAILETDPDIRLLFTDIDMPGSMDGLKLSVAVRDRWPPVKIIITSGHRSVRSSALPDGARFFSKPYKHADIVDSMRKLLAG
ncbi:response regulator [Mesorhizobium sp. SP-1A]|uniref:response regulator n=1 Tax=Mesorhizobium sp. SP-1A TaxID=3077840 RepID=UPI0028F721BA|nr:response regulator [Mesorhizobium sp. SP-1A]